LFLTLFLRGHGARGMQKDTAPKSIGRKLALALSLYAVLGCLALTFVRQSIFALSAYLHAMTFMFIGMFVASSSGEILFNRQEADILLHRPIRPRDLLRAKVRVLVEVSLYLAVAFNLAGFVVGIISPNGSWRFPFVHVISVALEALFCTGCVVLMYQLCLRWFGRERLESLMTMAQVVVALGAVLGGQLLPQFMFRAGQVVDEKSLSRWLALLPPAWFAGLDDALSGSGAMSSWLLGGLAIIATPLVLWLAFGKLAGDYESGLQMLNETTSERVRKRKRRRWLDALVDLPPLRWWLRDSVSRASFLLCAAYLVRDRDVKLRIYPAIAPMLVMPIFFLLPTTGRSSGGGFTGAMGVAFASGYLGLIPLLALNMLQFSQQWQASDIFRAAPLAGPAPLCHGARRAVLLLLTFPFFLFMAILTLLVRRDGALILLMLPGAIATPVFALIPNLGGRGLPLSLAGDPTRSTWHGLTMLLILPFAMIISGLAAFTWSAGGFWWLVLIETVLAGLVYSVLRRTITNSRWRSAE
jgi:hypothetical protein